jgi:hypothetical protein
MYRKILASVAAALSVTVLTSVPAQASPVALGHCSVGNICFWSGTNFSGTKKVFYVNVGGSGSCADTGLSGQAKSIENNSTVAFDVYKNYVCAAGNRVGTIYAKTANDNTSSPAWVTFHP